MTGVAKSGRSSTLMGLALGLAAFAIAATPPAPSGSARTAQRSAVLFIGDGMGPAYVTLTRDARKGSPGRLRMDMLPYTAVCMTHPADGPVTDSAAAASAMACGQKTVNGVLCEDATAVYAKQDGRKLESIALWAKKRGLRTGLVTTTTVTHATPAAFYACEKDRDNEEGIAGQAIASSIDLLLGGGRRYFPEELRTRARASGWTILQSAQELKTVSSLEKPVLGLFAEGHLPYDEEIEQARKQPGENDEALRAPTLPEMTRFAIDILKASGRPFFLMVEGGRIDHAGHANWAKTLVDETAAFDEAIGYAVDTLDPNTTLVLVTADHETGGLAVNGYPDEKDGVWSTYKDPFAEKGEEPYPVVTFMSGPGTKAQTTRRPPHGAEDPRPSGLSLGSGAHTGVDVTLYAWGAGAERVHGTLENTEIYNLLKAHLGGI